MKPIIFIFIFLWAQSLFALDLLGSYSQGFSDVEMYYSSNKSVSEYSVTGGYGLNKYINPSVGYGTATEDQNQIQSYDVGNISELLSLDSFNVFWATSLHMTKEDKAVCTELEFAKSYVHWTPYLRTELEKADNLPAEHSYSLGLTYKPFDQLEVLTEVHGKDRIETIGLGINYGINLSSELISEVNQETDSKEFTSTVGVIFTL